MIETGNKSPAQLVNTRTEDGVLLHGAFYEPDNGRKAAALLVHGGWGNFYTGLGRFMPDPLRSAGFACLSLNNRGHDYGTVADGEPCIGLMREQFEDCPKDIAAGIRLLKQRGYERLVLIGHSYGSAKVTYSQHVAPDPAVEGLILCTPATLMRDVWRFYLDIEYSEAVDEVKRLVDEGRGGQVVNFRNNGPIPLIYTARTFLSVWGPETAQNVCKFIGEMSEPILITVCERDRLCIGYSRTIYEHVAKNRHNEFVVLPGGDHNYTGAEIPLAEVIQRWLSRLELP